MSEAHEILVERASRWLANSLHCKWVVTNAKPFSNSEHADAIGWRPNGESTVIECKVSMNDFYADRRKGWRCTSTGMGFKKDYMAPKGLLELYQLPPAIGLLEVCGKVVRVRLLAQGRQSRDFASEICLLLSQNQWGKDMSVKETDQADSAIVAEATSAGRED